LTRRLRVLDEVTDEWSRGNFEVLTHDASGDELANWPDSSPHGYAIAKFNADPPGAGDAGERNRLARDLHDSVKQQFFATAMQVGAARALLPQQDSNVQSTYWKPSAWCIRPNKN